MNVKARAQDKVDETKEQAKEKVDEAKTKAKDDGRSGQGQAQRLVDQAKSAPRPIAGGHRRRYR